MSRPKHPRQLSIIRVAKAHRVVEVLTTTSGQVLVRHVADFVTRADAQLFLTAARAPAAEEPGTQDARHLESVRAIARAGQ